MIGAEWHRCDADPDRRYTYLPALDSTATDVPGGAKIRAPMSIGQIPPFDYSGRDKACFVCAYAEGLCTGRLEPPLDRLARTEAQAEADRQTAMQAARARLRGKALSEVARRALAPIEAEKQARNDAAAPHWRPMTEQEVRVEDQVEAAAVGLHKIVERVVEATDLGATREEAVAVVARNAPVKDDVLDLPPEAIGASKKGKGRKKKGGGHEGHEGQGSLF